MRLRTVSWMRSASRARVACQWKAKPRISTTKPVVADSVTVSAVSERQLRERVVARLDDGELAERVAAAPRTVAKAGLPSASVISSTPAAAPKSGQRLRRAEHVEQRRARVGRGIGGHAGDDDAVGIG